MSNERIDLTNIKITSDLSREDAQTHTECWAEGTLGNGGPLMDYLIVELKRCYNVIDDLTWRHMQVLRERKDLRDECLRLARKLDKLRTTEEE